MCGRGAASLGVLFLQEGWRARAPGCGCPSVIVCLPRSCWVWKARPGSIWLGFKSAAWLESHSSCLRMLSGVQFLISSSFPLPARAPLALQIKFLCSISSGQGSEGDAWLLGTALSLHGLAVRFH